jgi:hypothetical protein
MRSDAIVAELTTPSVATMKVDFYTVVRSGTGERNAGRFSQRQALARIGRLRAREKWIVIGWMRQGRAFREAFRVDAAEFWWAHRPPPAAVVNLHCIKRLVGPGRITG